MFVQTEYIGRTIENASALPEFTCKCLDYDICTAIYVEVTHSPSLSALSNNCYCDNNKHNNSNSRKKVAITIK